MRKLLTAGLLPAMLVGWTGCAKAPEPTEPTPPAATPGEAAPATAETPPTATPAAAFQWTAAPTVEMIPADPVRGEANGKPFEVKFICFEPTSDGWRLTLTDKARILTGRPPIPLVRAFAALQASDTECAHA